MDKMIESLKSAFPLNELGVGEFAKIKVKGMNFTINRYYAEGLGNVSVMRAVGFFGLMKMDTLIINPTECDMPLFSYDRVLAMGNDTLILELYDTPSKKGKKNETASFNKMAHDYFKAYVESAKKAPACEVDAKKAKASVYVEGLLSNGGPSTDIFRQHYGEDKTAYLFRKILFGTA